MIYKFTNTDFNYEGCTAHELYKRLEKGEKVEAKQNLFDELFHSEAYRHGIYRLMGWVFDFRPFFKRYVVKHKDYGWLEHYALNKTFIRVNATTPSHILEIVELPKK